MNRKKTRCPWVNNGKQDYIDYHDTEWGVPVYDDRIHFEFLTLESAQAGLSWYTILKRRDSYRKAFADFDPEVVAGYDEMKIQELMNDAGIIRNRRKIEAAVNNARCFLTVQKEFGSFSGYIWSFVNGRTIVNEIDEVIPATSPESDALTRDMKSRGFKFVGSTVMYAHMQATGLVNDHIMKCFRRKETLKLCGDSG